MASIAEIRRGDYVKVDRGTWCKIAETYGVREDGSLAKPSEGFFGVITTCGQKIDGFHALAYCRREELDATMEADRR